VREPRICDIDIQVIYETFRLLALRCGTAYHRRLRRNRLWRPSALDSRRFCSL